MIRDARTALFVPLLTMAILSILVPTSAMAQTIPDKEDSFYIDEIIQQEAIKELDMEKREQFINKAHEQMESTPFNKQVYGLLEELSKIKAEIANAEKAGKDTVDLIKDGWEIVHKLENYGVVSEEQLLQNTEHWNDKAEDAMEKIQSGQAVGSVEPSVQHDIMTVHTDGIRIELDTIQGVAIALIMLGIIVATLTVLAWKRTKGRHKLKAK